MMDGQKNIKLIITVQNFANVPKIELTKNRRADLSV